MNYSEWVSLVNEQNRPSGGIRTVQLVGSTLGLNQEDSVIEVGSNTGFTSVNLSLLFGCNSVGFDINERSVNYANQYATGQGVKDLCSFHIGDLLNIPRESESADLLWASNVTSFVHRKTEAIQEYSRLLCFKGFLVLIPIYYRTSPPSDLVQRVGAAIGCPIQLRYKTEWLELIHSSMNCCDSAFEKVFDKDFGYHDVSDSIPQYLDTVLKRIPKNTSQQEAENLRKEGRYFYDLFNENLKYCGYSVMIFQKRKVLDQEELFVSKEV